MKEFRLLRADEIECRVAMIKNNGLSLLLYKDARCDMNILDETVGMYNWKKEYSRDNKNCIVSIWDELKGQWISKEDTGTESNTEAEKGLASDSFKRACFNFGIGRELYTAPFIWIPNTACKITGDNGRYKCFDRFEVKEIAYDSKERISKLAIYNATSKEICFTFATSSEVEKVTEVQAKALEKLILNKEYTVEYVCNFYKVKELTELNQKQYRNVVEFLEKKNGKQS